MSVAEIEAAITQLTAEDLASLMQWLEQYHGKAWDDQIEDDLQAGRLDSMLVEVDKEYDAGMAEPL
jgi:hypothetical protein